MSEPDAAWRLLSPDEIEAIVDELAGARRDAERLRRPAGLDPESGGRADRLAGLRRGLERFARDQARALASRFQRRIDLSLLALDEARPADLAAAMLPSDRVLVFAATPGGEPGFLLLSRPLLFAWMRLAFGAREPGALSPPERPYTQIELRFLRRIGAELVERLAPAAGLGGMPEIRGLEGVAALRDARTPRLVLASFELAGFEEIGRLRLALPRGVLGDTPAAGARREAGRETSGALTRSLLDAPLWVAVAAGTAQVTVAQLAALRVGDVLPVAARRDGGVVVAVEGVPRFRGMRGAMDGRLAVQIIDRLDAGEEAADGSVAAR
ncbi:MAG: FliM/FliN family flagellar motor switch protein [Deltaproteobacteria bacterium]|nr:FliM/FliN family flagellar motor switch protein [Deltaproteobacteria bacterium]